MKNPSLTPVLLIIILLILSVYDSSAQPYWERLTPSPQENSINDVTKIPGTNKTIAVAEGSTIMISDDDGETWELILNPAGLPNDIPFKTVYFYNSTIGFIGGNYLAPDKGTPTDFILKTEDGGLSWTVNTELPGTSYNEVNDFYFINQDTGFAVGYHGKILKTTDGGENWSDIESGANFTLNSIDFCNDSTGYIVGDSFEGILKTTDFGNTWTENLFISPFTEGSLANIQFVSDTIGFITHNFGGILKTTNAGISWEISFSDEDIKSRSIDFFDENHGISGCHKNAMESCILTTHDGGITWSEFVLPKFQLDNYSVCCMDTSISLFFGHEGMIYKSTDGGEVYNPKYERDFHGNIYQVQYVDTNTIYCLTTETGELSTYHYSQLNKSVNGGESFTSILDIPINSTFTQTTAAAFHFLNSNLGYLTYYHYDNLLTVLKTIDGGDTWEEVESGNFDTKPYVIQFYDEQNGIISGQQTIFKTSDGGNTWEEVYYYFYALYLMDIHYFTNDEVIVAGETYPSSVLLTSNDGGKNWNELPIGNYGAIYDMEIFDNSIYLACGDNTILKSPDGGDTWQFTQVNTQNDIEFHSINFPTEDIGYAVGSGLYETMVKTTDGGDTWDVIESGITSGLNVVHFYDENIGYVYGDNGVVLKTTTGGTADIEDHQAQKAKTYFSVFPNPFTISFTLDYQFPAGLNNGTIEIFDQTGKSVLIHQLNHETGYTKFSGDKLKPGIYLIVLKKDQIIHETQKIIKLP